MDAILVSEPNPPFGIRVVSNDEAVYVTVGRTSYPQTPIVMKSGQTVALSYAQASELGEILLQSVDDQLVE